MYSILIVDDELPSVQGLLASVNWEKLNISQVYTALDAAHAREVFRCENVDIMLCDIEMPKESGLDLLRWAVAEHPRTVCVLLTCHADFTYAKQAVQMGAFDYLLKPAPIAELEAVLTAAARTYRERSLKEKLSVYGEQWLKNLDTIKETVWLDILAGNIAPEKGVISDYLAGRNIAIEFSELYRPILCAARKTGSCGFENSLLDFSFRNMLGELFAPGGQAPVVLSAKFPQYLILIPADAESIDERKLRLACDSFVRTLQRHFQHDACFYCGGEADLETLPAVYRRLLAMKKNNVSCEGQLFFEEEEAEIKVDVNAPYWRMLLFSSDESGFYKAVENTLQKAVSQKQMSGNYLTVFYHTFLQVIYSGLSEKNIMAERLFSELDLDADDALASVETMLSHIKAMIRAAVGYISIANQKETVVERVKKYIAEHIGDELSRDEIAAYVYLNPSYLSRMFHEKTSESLTEYITNTRMELVYKLLSETDLSVTEVAYRAGYYNMPYFCKTFRKRTGKSPREYRRPEPNM